MPLPPDIAAAIKAGDTVITSSARAARALRRLHGEAQRDLGRQAWKSADILDWDSWLNRLWQKQLRSGAERRLLLTSLQEQQVWVRVIRPDVENKRLISVLSVSELAQEAYGLLAAYRALDFLHATPGVSQDVEDFRKWGKAFASICRSEGWLPRSELALALRDAVTDSTIRTNEKLMLLGFERLTPAQEFLIEAVRGSGHPVAFAEARTASSSHLALLVEAIDRRDEILMCAQWARGHLAAKPNSRIAVIVPGAAGIRSEIERIFRQELAPQTVAIAGNEVPLPFEFSLGVPLAQLPMARAALLLLRWMHHALLQDQASWLWLSGFVSQDEEELLSLARFDARLRQQSMRQPEQDLDTFLTELDEGRRDAIPLAGLRTRLRMARRLAAKNRLLTYTEWAIRAGRMLKAVGWPGAHTLQSEDFQVQARWVQLLDTLAALGFDGARVKYDEFLEVLEQQAAKTIFAPESREAPVQILGPLEASGLTFDALWFLNADDATWPAPARPHPLLSRSLQRKHGMPHANSDVDWKLAQQVTLRLQEATENCAFSYSAQNTEGACRPSTLVASMKPALKTSALRLSLGEVSDGTTDHDYPAHRWEDEPSTIVAWPAERDAGGSEVLKDQAACAFRSFAKRRMAARAMEESDWGLDSRARGSVVHGILENVWAELKSRDSLVLAGKEARLPAIVMHHVDEALRRYRADGSEQEWNRAYLDAERERIVSLIEHWLAYEAKRAPFTVEAREERRTAAVGDLKLQVRVDRIDAVSGGRVIIDYKTGVVRPGVWDGERPDDPQLPIYATGGQVGDLQGVLLGRVAEEKPGFIGRVVSSDAIMPGNGDLSEPPYSGEMLQQWNSVLLDLSQQFVRGEAQINPKRYPKTCEFCKLPGLCRIAEREEADADDAEHQGQGEPG